MDVVAAPYKVELPFRPVHEDEARGSTVCSRSTGSKRK